MRTIGSPTDWINLLDSLVPEILALVIATWEEMPAPAGDALEDPVTNAFCIRLRAGRNRCDLPFRIDTQLVELEPAAGQDQGRLDIVFSPLIPREDIYFCLECKRLNVRGENAIRPLFVEYVRFGMLRFVRGQYANSVRNAGMLAYVLDGNVVGAIVGVQTNVSNLHRELGMDPPGALLASSILSADSRIRETRHRRLNHSEPFVIHHLFMARDSSTALRHTPSPSTFTPKKNSKSTTRRSRN